MVASVSERGYAATRLSDLVELSGVARKSFYVLFANKEQCFVEAVQTLLAAVIRTTTSPTGSWEEQVRGSAAAFAELVVAHPAAARVCLTETYVVGQAALTPVEEAAARFEAHALSRAQEAGLEGKDLPAMIGAHVGALMEIARERLRLGRESELPKLIDDFADLALQYQPPPQPLRLASRPPTPAPETLDAHGHVERVLRAFAAVVVERGYAATTIELVLKRASMSPTTFYANFASREEVLFAAIESAGLQLLAAILPSFHRNPAWTHGVRAAFGEFFNFLASRPALARLLLVEVYAAGPTALERREEALRPLEVLLAERRPRSVKLAPVALEAIAGGVYQLAYRQVREAGTESLPDLAPLCTYLTLAPLIGAEEAMVVANGDGHARRASAEGHDQPMLSQIGSILYQRKASAEMLAREVGVAEERVLEQIRDLEQAALVVAVEEEAEDGSREVFYHSNSDYIDDDRWELMDLAERRAASKPITQLLTAEIEQAIELGTFDARIDRHLSRVPMEVDERGWRELMALHYKTFHASIAIQAESAERLQQSRGRGISGSSVQVLFEVPKPPFLG
jgi:AcrR family transcriptional regulator